MKFLHIIHLNEQNSYQLFKQLHETYDLSEHTFLVFNSKSALKNFPSFYEFENFIYLPEERVQKALLIYRLMRKAKYIIFNSLFFNTNKELAFVYYAGYSFLDKAVWMEWGGDLYNWKKPETDRKSKFINHINYKLRKRMKIVGVTFEADEEEVHRQFGSDIKCFFTPLPFGADRLELLESTRKGITPTHPVRVQVAHNSLQVNNHIPILARLEKFEDQNIQLVLPLNYGTFGIGNQYGGTSYRDSVVQCAKKLFGNKAVIMSKKIALKSYMRYLWNIDIAIFDCTRPIALANIYYMLYMRKKVYLPSDSIHYKFFKEVGLPVYDTYDIPNQSFDEFVSNDVGAIPDYIIKKFTPGEEIKYWGEFFEQIERIMGEPS